jgi:mRNA interferase MazF
MGLMMFDRGGIYLARLYPSRGHEPGKTRPVLVLQSDALNHVGHTTVIIVPLTTQLIDDAYPLRYRLPERDDLHRPSDLLCDQIRAIDVRRLLPEKLTMLTPHEMMEVEIQVEMVLGFGD